MTAVRDHDFSLHYPASRFHHLTPEHFLDSPLEPVASSAGRAAACLRE